MYTCSTEFDLQYRPFYVFRLKRKLIGCIPAGVDITYMKMKLHTIDAVQKVHEHYLKTKTLPKMHTMKEWYDDEKLNKKLFRDFMRHL